MIFTFIENTVENFVGLTISFCKEMLEVFQEEMLLKNFSVPLEVVELLLVKLMAESSTAKHIDSLLMLEVLQV